AQFAAAVGLRNWKPVSNQPLAVNASVRNGDLADVMVMAGVSGAAYSGPLSANADIRGTVGNPHGTLALQVANGTIQGERFDSIQAQVIMADQLITIPNAYISAGPARVNLTAEFQHPRDSFAKGRLHAHVQSNDVNLSQLRAA